ncbi:uncharacterized protein LOC129774246 [Toxorhynchites rutilus septentrionalis]|uniref:uncharacterized protein LOC129774246 n=1 Tax=Toxorhynchites rutilus septentrionalis TaxID=329112 RepID=UPI0024798EC5|nr:uncharacterized protein LOC129774246 [Toxorhynchites rutilus septentrionalis]
MIHSKGGFIIRNWASNSRDVLDHLGEGSADGVKELNLTGNGNTERVLGMLWKSAEDDLIYSTSFRKDIASIIDSGVRPTKRQILKCIMSLFNPLGLLASFLVHGKILMQEVWCQKIQWDERVNDHIYSRWTKWISLFSQVREIRIRRCYFENASSSMYETLEVHTFVDASEDAYSAVVYFRVKALNGTIQCTIVAAKTKVVPLQHATIPRLELMAALLGVRLTNFVVDGHSVTVRRRVFWSDSRTVLAWIGSEHRRYRQFVACRVGEILSSTNANEWRWSPSNLNVANDATKWGKGPCFDASSRWFIGPQFLYSNEQNWPQSVQGISSTDEELRPCNVHQVAPLSLIQFDRFSNWHRLLRTVAYIKRFVNASKKKMQQPFKKEILCQQELQTAENLLWRIIQLDTYTDEITILQKNERLPIDEHQTVDKSSVLFKLTPTLDDQRILRVDGRIGALHIASADQKCPIILPRHHRVTFLVVDSYHRKYLHANSETVVNEVRQRFYVPRLRVLVKTVVNRCLWCKI